MDCNEQGDKTEWSWCTLPRNLRPCGSLCRGARGCEYCHSSPSYALQRGREGRGEGRERERGRKGEGYNRT
eukprot:344807-Hanusia_phi.AAC.9